MASAPYLSLNSFPMKPTGSLSLLPICMDHLTKQHLMALSVSSDVKLQHNANIGLDGSIESLYNIPITSVDCVTTASCFTTLNETGNCTIQYGLNSSYQDLVPPIIAPLNTSFNLPLIESSTLYYVQIIYMLESENITVRRTYTTGNGMTVYLLKYYSLTCCHVIVAVSRLTVVNLLLIVIGLVVCVVAIVLILIGIRILKKGLSCQLELLCQVANEMLFFQTPSSVFLLDCSYFLQYFSSSCLLYLLLCGYQLLYMLDRKCRV